MRAFLKKILRAALVVLALLLLVGAVYQWVRSTQDRAAYPPPGAIVDVDGLAIHLDCRGEGSPVVLLEAGLTSGSSSWALVHDEIASFTRVCAYDRPGIDWSEHLGRRADATEIAVRLRRLIEAAEMGGPWILVGMSAGGIYVREYFAKFPENIVGMILVDSSHEEQGTRLSANGEDPADLATLLAVCSYLQPFGIVRALGIVDDTIDTSWQVEIPPWAEDAIKANANQSHGCAAIYYELESFRGDNGELSVPTAPRSLGDLPLIVLSQGNEPRAIEEIGLTRAEAIAQRAVWDELQEELKALSSRGERRIATESGHVIQLEQPDLVIDAVRDMVLELRSEQSAS